LLIAKPSRRVGSREEERERVRNTTLMQGNHFFVNQETGIVKIIFLSVRLVGRKPALLQVFRNTLTLQHRGRYSIMGSVSDRKNMLSYQKETF
jgi:hypothetical protein